MEKIEREFEQVTEGRHETTPFKVLASVWVVVAAFAGFLIVVSLLIWSLLR